MKNLLYVVFMLLIMNQTSLADDKSTVKELLESKLDAAISILQKKDLEQQAKNKKIIAIVTPVFDFPLMAKLSLGRKHWPGLSKEKKDRFTDIFTKRLKESYINKLTLYTDEKIIYKPPVQSKRKIKIPTELISKNNKISMLYKFRQSKHNWKIYDIEVEGVSIISTYRSQFDQALGKGTIDDLLLKLEKPET